MSDNSDNNTPASNEAINEAIDDNAHLEPVEIEEGPDDTPPLTPQEQKKADIIAKYNAQEHGVIVDKNGNEVTASMSDEDYDDADPEPPAPAPESPVFLNSNNEYAMNLKVNGQEVARTLKEITADSQKHLSADRRLQELAERQKAFDAQQQEFDRRQAHLLAQEAALNKQSSPEQSTPLSSQDASAEALESAKAVMEQIYEGNTDEAAQTLAQLIEEGRQVPTQQAIDAAAIERHAAEQAIAKIEARDAERTYKGSIDKGAQWVEENHPEIMASEALTRYVDTEIKILTELDRSISPEDAIKQATKTVLDQMGRPAPNDSTASNRAHNKANLRRVPGSKSLQRRRAEPTPLDSSPSAVIDRMRKHRDAIKGL